MALLNWRAAPDSIPDVVTRVMKIGGQEIVKFLQDVLDALFSVFVTEDGTSTPHSGQVFHALVHIFATLKDPQFQHFQPVMDAYISDHFAAALVYRGLLSCVNHVADKAAMTDRQEAIKKLFRCMDQVFRLIVASRQLFARATGGENADSFRVEVHLLFNTFNKMLSYRSEAILESQVEFLTNLSSVYPSLLKVLPCLDLAKLVTLTLGSLTSGPGRPLARAALLAARQAVSSQLCRDPAGRTLLLPACLEHAALALNLRQDLELATELLLDTVEVAETDPAAVTRLADGCLQGLSVAVVAEQESGERGEQVWAGLAAALLATTDLLVAAGRSSRLLDPQILTVLAEVTAGPVLPSAWSAFSASVSAAVSRALIATAACLSAHPMDRQTWMSFARLCAAAAGSARAGGELRLDAARQLAAAWRDCPDQIQLVPALVSPVLDLILLPNQQIRRTVLPILTGLMEVEQGVRGNFKQTETELVEKLDILINDSREDEEYKEVFSSLLLDLAPQLDQGSVFVSSVSALLERLLDYRETLEGEGSGAARLACTANLLRFYRDDPARQELFLRYVYKLRDLHLAAGSRPEAAFTLLLHAHQLDWSTRVLHADLQFPAQQEWQRKEQLYLQIIELFTDSQVRKY